MWFRQFGWRRDFGIQRTVGNCLLAGMLLAGAVAFFSCREQMAVQSTPQMSVEQRFMVRVLLADDANHCTVKDARGL